MSDDNLKLRWKVAMHLLPLSICLRGIYLLTFIEFIKMWMYPQNFSWVPILACTLAVLLEWYTVDLVESHNLFKKDEKYD